MPTTTDLDPRRWWTLAVLCLSLLLIVVDTTIVNVALPSLQADLDASAGELQWVVDAYVLVFAGFLLSAGALGDRFGRKQALFAGLVVMALASALSAFATHPAQLVATRALMGLGGAFVMPATLSILTNVFTDPKERGRAIAVWAATSGMAVAVGPLSGGWLLEHFWWGSVFLVNLPVIAVAVVAGAVIIPNSRGLHTARLDLVGAALSIAGLVTVVWAIIEAPHAGWASAQTVAGLTAAAVLLAAFAWWERRIDHPMLPLEFFRDPRFSAAGIAVTLSFFAHFGSMFLVTQYLQLVLGYTPLEAGVRLAPMAAVMMLVSPMSARFVERFGSKMVIGTGLCIAAGGLCLLATVGVDDGYASVFRAIVVLAAGMALTMAPATESIMGSLPRHKAGVGSAVNDATRKVGGALGVAVMGSVMASAYGARVGDAVRAAGLPEAAAQAARDSLHGAFAVARRIGGDTGATVTEVARQAFVDGMSWALFLGAGVVLVAAAFVFALLPARASEPDPEPGVGTAVDAAVT